MDPIFTHEMLDCRWDLHMWLMGKCTLHMHKGALVTTVVEWLSCSLSSKRFAAQKLCCKASAQSQLDGFKYQRKYTQMTWVFIQEGMVAGVMTEHPSLPVLESLGNQRYCRMAKDCIVNWTVSKSTQSNQRIK